MNLLRKVSGNLYSTRYFEWTKKITLIGFSQLLVQLISFACGILIIRLLSPDEYALYTIANMMLGTMAVLGDSGIGAGTMSQGGKVWQQRKPLGEIMVTALHLRQKFFLLTLIVAVPILIYLLNLHGSSWWIIFLIVLAVIPSFLASITDTVYEVPAKLNQDVEALQKNAIGVSVLRLCLLLATLFIFPIAAIAILAAGLSRSWGNRKLYKISLKYADLKAAIDPAVRSEILRIVKRVLPGAIYFCLSAQISIWLISIFGNIRDIAQVGALSRLGMALGLFTAILYTFVLPRFARLVGKRQLLLYKFIQIQAVLCLWGGLIMMFVFVFPEQILWILGADYAGLIFELKLSIAGSWLALIIGTTVGLSQSRGWILNPLISIPVTISAIISGALILDVSSLRGVLKFNIYLAFVEIAMYYIYCAVKINQAEK